jgi:3-dehydroquinate synthase
MQNKDQSVVLFEADALVWLKAYLLELKHKCTPVFLLLDTNTKQHCLPALCDMLGTDQSQMIQIVVDAGETNKNLDSCQKIWQTFTQNNAGRDAVLINLGGGMITDLGGFAASVYKRGIATVHIPTSLLAMVDASIGSKTAIDFEGFKNNIGTFYQAEAVLIFSLFLQTLPKRELISALAEIVKYGYIYQKELLKQAEYEVFTLADPLHVIRRCIGAKQSIVAADPMEKGYRKILNFGHTLGHAFESWSHEKGEEMLHGEAIAMGMYCELWLSEQLYQLPDDMLQEYDAWYRRHFTPGFFDAADIERFYYFMLQDKKNVAGQLRFVLIEQLAKAVCDIPVATDLVAESLNYFSKSFFQNH